MDTKRLLIAAVLSLAVMIAWSYFFPSPEPQQAVPPPALETESPAAPAPEVPPPSVETEPLAVAEPVESTTPETEEEVSATGLEAITGSMEERVVVTAETFRAEFTSRGAQLVSFLLSEHQNADGGPVDLVRARTHGPYLFGFAEIDGTSSPFNEALFQVRREPSDLGQETLVFLYQGPEGRVEKRFTFQPTGLLDVEIEAATDLPWAVALGPGIRNPSSAELDNRFTRRSAVYRNAEGVERIDPGGVKAPEGLSGIGLQWVGLDDSYFLTAVVPAESWEGVVVQPVVVIPGSDTADTIFQPFRTVEELTEEERDLGRELFLLLQPQGNRFLHSPLHGRQARQLRSNRLGLDGKLTIGRNPALPR